MSSTAVAVIVWCIFMIITIQSVYTDDDYVIDYDTIVDTKPEVNFENFGDLITHSKTILVNGMKFNSNDWFSRKNYRSAYKNDMDYKTSLTFIKCEFANYIKFWTTIVYRQLTFCPDGINFKVGYILRECFDGVRYLYYLRDFLSSSMATLIEMANQYPNLWSHEQRLPKTIFLAYMYINGLNDPAYHQPVNYNYLLTLTQFDNNYVEKMRVARQLFDRMRRVVWQIVSLVDSFTIEFGCSQAVRSLRFEENGLMGNFSCPVLNQTRRDFFKFQINVVWFEPNLVLYPVEIDDFKLRNCMTVTVPESANALPPTRHHDQLCYHFLQDASVQKPDDDSKFMTLKDFYNDITHRYDVSSVYEYMRAVQRVLWKLILRETAWLWTKDGASDIVEDCEGIVSKLQSKGFPVETVEHFRLICNVQSYREQGRMETRDVHAVAERIGLVADRHDNVQLPDSRLEDFGLTLTDVMDVILGYKLKHFWKALNLLRREHDSRSAFDLSLDLDLKNVPSKNDDNSTTKCDKLTNIYMSFFGIQSMYNGCLLAQNKRKKNPIDQTVCYQDIRRRYESLSNTLLKSYRNWQSIVYLQNDTRLQNIVLVTIIHLINEFNTDADTANLTDAQMTDLISLKRDKSKRIGDYIMNLLDIYQSRYCAIIRYRDYLYEQKYRKESPAPIEDIFPEDKLLGSCNPTTEIDNQMKDNGNNDFYSIPLLTGKEIIDSLGTLAKGIQLYWRGELKSFYDIQMDISKNFLNVYDLVEYQNMYVHFAFDVFYTSWFLYTQHFLNSDDAKLNLTADDPNCDSGIKTILDFHEIEFPAPYKKFAVYCQDKIDFFNILCKGDTECVGKRVADVVREEILSPMYTLLGTTVNVNDLNISDIKQIFQFNEFGPQQLSEIIVLIRDILSMLNKHFIYFEHSPNSLKPSSL